MRVGSALDSLAQLADEGHVFDLVFLDADKPNNPAYLEWSLKMTKPGSFIIADNVVRGGDVLNVNSDDPSVQGVQSMNKALADNPRLDVTAIQTVGSKGYDGFALARVIA